MKKSRKIIRMHFNDAEEKVIEEVRKLGRFKTATEAVEAALHEYVRVRKLRQTKSGRKRLE